MQKSSFMRYYVPSWTAGVLLLGLTGCATVSVTPGNIQRPDPAMAYNAIEAEPVMPAKIAVADFDFAPSSVIENRSGFHHALDFFLRNSSAQQRQIAIGRKAATVLSDKTAQRLGKTGLQVTRIPAGSDVPLPADSLLVTGRLLEVNEGNLLTRVAFGFGLGESHLVSEVRVYRVVNREQAEVLAFTTHANSGKMPGIAASVGFGYFLIGPITIITRGRARGFKRPEDLRFPNRLPGRPDRRSGSALSFSICRAAALDFTAEGKASPFCRLSNATGRHVWTSSRVASRICEEHDLNEDALA